MMPPKLLCRCGSGRRATACHMTRLQKGLMQVRQTRWFATVDRRKLSDADRKTLADAERTAGLR